jgi:hypothetical protein
MARYKTIAEVVNQVAVEVGIPKAQDPFASADSSHEQLISIARSCAVELQQHHEWNQFVREHTILTTPTDTGKYNLPDDFHYMVDQTGWERNNEVPLFGPLSSQEWQWLQGRNLVNYTIYASFRLSQGQIWIFPWAGDNSDPPPAGLKITFEYQSRNWVLGSSGTAPQDFLDSSGNVVLFEPYLFERLLKVRFLEARGFDTTGASEQFRRAFNSWTGKDKGAPVLNVGGRGFAYPYLDSYRNTPDTGYGS